MLRKLLGIMMVVSKQRSIAKSKSQSMPPPLYKVAEEDGAKAPKACTVKDSRPLKMKAHEDRKHIDRNKFRLSTKAKTDLIRKLKISGGTALKSQAKADAAGIERILVRATEVIGSRQKAMTWLGTPVRGLGFATPISLLGTEVGKEQVADILGQMEHGVW